MEGYNAPFFVVMVAGAKPAHLPRVENVLNSPLQWSIIFTVKRVDIFRYQLEARVAEIVRKPFDEINKNFKQHGIFFLIKQMTVQYFCLY